VPQKNRVFQSIEEVTIGFRVLNIRHNGEIDCATLCLGEIRVKKPQRVWRFQNVSVFDLTAISPDYGKRRS